MIRQHSNSSFISNQHPVDKPFGIGFVAIALQTSLSEMTIMGEATKERERWIADHSACNDLGLAHFVAEATEAEFGRFFRLLKHFTYREQRDLLCELIETKLTSDGNSFMTLVQVNQIALDAREILDLDISRCCPRETKNKLKDRYVMARQNGNPVDKLEMVKEITEEFDVETRNKRIERENRFDFFSK